MELILLLIAHILGDFIFQSSELAKRKTKSLKYFLIHCLIYSAMVFLALIWFAPTGIIALIFFGIISLHALIDGLHILIKRGKNYGDKKTIKRKRELIAFLFDQLIHLLIIVVFSSFIKSINGLGQMVLDFISAEQLNKILLVGLLYLLITTPAAVLIRLVFRLFSIGDGDKEENEDLIKSGYLIGVLERFIMLTLGLSGQIGAIGFVIAAKSLARFKQLDDKHFAEKYLVGTLLSVVVAIVCIVIGTYYIYKI